MIGVKRVLRGFFKNRSGATAVEFALVSPLIFAAMLGAFETGFALYERNRTSAACSAGAREILISGADDNTAIEAAVRARYRSAEQEDVKVNLATKTVSGETFKEIVVAYTHELIVGLAGYDSFTFSITCYGRGV